MTHNSFPLVSSWTTNCYHWTQYWTRMKKKTNQIKTATTDNDTNKHTETTEYSLMTKGRFCELDKCFAKSKLNQWGIICMFVQVRLAYNSFWRLRIEEDPIWYNKLYALDRSHGLGIHSSTSSSYWPVSIILFVVIALEFIRIINLELRCQ